MEARAERGIITTRVAEQGRPTPLASSTLNDAADAAVVTNGCSSKHRCHNAKTIPSIVEVLLQLVRDTGLDRSALTLDELVCTKQGTLRLHPHPMPRRSVSATAVSSEFTRVSRKRGEENLSLNFALGSTGSENAAMAKFSANLAAKITS